MKLCLVCVLATIAILGSFVTLRAGRTPAGGLMPEVVSAARAPLGDVPEVVVTAPAAGTDVSMDPGAVAPPESAAN